MGQDVVRVLSNSDAFGLGPGLLGLDRSCR